MIEEQKLVTRVLAGDADAEEKFYGTYSVRLLKASRYFLGAFDSEAEDVVQETFLIAMSKLDQYDFCAPIYFWLRQICLRLCYTRMRNRNRMLLGEEQDMEQYLETSAITSMEIADQEERKQAQLDLLARLRKQMHGDGAEIMELRDVQGRSYAEISQLLGIPMGTVMSRLSRARDTLRGLVEAALAETPPEGSTQGERVLSSGTPRR